MSVKKEYKEISYITYPATQGQEFGHPTWIKYGKEEDVQSYIEANKTDTEIYECLEKYGCLKPLEMDYEGTYADFTAMNDLRGSLDKIKMANEMWKQVPAEIKKDFNNDIHEFVDRGMEYIQKRIQKETAQPAVAPAPAEPKREPAVAPAPAEPKGEKK